MTLSKLLTAVLIILGLSTIERPSAQATYREINEFNYLKFEAEFMKKSKLLILSLLALSGLISSEKALAVNYFPVCRIEDGQAMGYIASLNNS